VLRAEAPEMADSIAFLNTAAALPVIGEHENVMIYDPVPMKLATAPTAGSPARKAATSAPRSKSWLWMLTRGNMPAMLP